MASSRDERAFGEAEQTGRFETDQLERLVARSTQPSALFEPGTDAPGAGRPVLRPQRRIVVRTEAGRRLVWRPIARPTPDAQR